MDGRDIVPQLIGGLPGGLYVISPSIADDSELEQQCLAALLGGARILQYREKPKPQKHRALMLQKICREAGALLIINDDSELAATIDADGVHLGKNDGAITTARGLLGSGKIIGVSIYNRPELASKVWEEGADYCAMGAVYPSLTKPEALSCPLENIKIAKAGTGLPIVAIGGITPLNAESVYLAGADWAAVCGGVFTASDITEASREISDIFLDFSENRRSSNNQQN